MGKNAEPPALSALEERILRMRYGVGKLSGGAEPALTATTDPLTRASLAALEQTLREAAGKVPGLPFGRRQRRTRRS